MRLLYLRMRNFRQHADTEIHFRPGLTGIIGPNGAGKSTILEAIAWAVYGAQAARGTNETIRFSRAGPRTRVEVELGFALGGHEYRVVRWLAGAEVFLDGGGVPVATTLAGATVYLQSRIGMTREEFFNTYFTGQKELQFLVAMKPTERQHFMSQVLGYERLRRAQELARLRRSELRSEIKGLRTALGDLDELVAARLEAARKSGEAVAALGAAQAEMEEAAAAVKAVTPRWERAQAARERHRELTHALEAAERDREAARREVERTAAELEKVAAAEAELAPLREQLAALPALEAEFQQLAELARQEERRGMLALQLADLEGELARLGGRAGKLEEAPELERAFADELARLRAERAEVEGDLQAKNTAWLTDRQDAFTKLGTQRDRARELKEQIQQIERLGPEGTCPTCGRRVGDDYARLLEELREQYASVVQDGKWFASRFEQVDKKPAELVEMEKRDRTLSAQIDDRAQKHTWAQAAVRELEGVRAEKATREKSRDAVQGEMGKLAVGYDRTRHQAAEGEVKRLQRTATHAARLEETAGRRGDWEGQQGEAKGREAAAAKAHKAAAAERGKLGYAEEDFLAVKAEHEAASQRHRASELRATELKGAVRTAEQVLQDAQRAERQYHERAREIAAHEGELRHHEELDRAYSELRTELNDQVRPELSEIASLFLAQLTDGRYTAMEIDDGYNLMVLDEGEEKPVISGGEEDVANLVLRLSLSQMIAERAGHPLSLLILDEIFGSLDVARRDNVVQLLHNLEDRFDQVILITHIEGIREGLDQVLRVDYDERTGTSIVREQTMGPGEDFPAAA